MNETLTLEQWENRLSKRKREHRELTEEIAEIESCIESARSHFTGEDRRRMESDRMRLELMVQHMRGKPVEEQGRIAGQYAYQSGIPFAEAMERYLRAVGEEV